MSPLSTGQLAYVVTHSELLVMLSLQRLDMLLDASAVDAPEPSADELAAAEAALLADMARQQQQWLAQADGAEATPPGDAIFAVPAAALPTGSFDLGPEIEAALARAYADIPARTQALQGVDAASLQPALDALPEALPPLTGALDAAGVSAWLDLHDAGDPTLGQLMADACALGGSAG